MEIRLRSTMPGCISVPCTIVTLGLFQVLLKMAEGHFPKVVDEQGILTRSGKRFAWNEFVRVERVKAVNSSGGVLSDEYVLYTAKDKVSLHQRIIDWQEVVEYAFQHLTPGIEGLHSR